MLLAVKGAVKTEYEFGSLKRLFCMNNNDKNFIANLEQIIKIVKNMEGCGYYSPPSL